MSWKDDKDLGSWEFDEQPDKWGYLNNPRWSNSRKSASDSMSASEFCEDRSISLNPEDTHKPCGHWHKVNADEQFGTYLYGAGRSAYGQLNIDGGTYNRFFLLSDLEGWSVVRCGQEYTLAIRDTGVLYVFGYGRSGELGNGVYGDVIEMDSIEGIWSYVIGGRKHSMAMKPDGSLWGTGDNQKGQLGIPSIGYRTNVFTQVGIGTDWKIVDTGSGSNHTVALKTDNSLWVTGYNYYGQLGLGDHGTGTDRTSFTQVGSGTDWSDISVGELHTLAVKSDGTLWSTGMNNKGQLGHGNTTDLDVFTQVGSDTNWSKCHAGEYYSYAQKKNGTIYATGDNDHGQLGQGNQVQLESFTQVGTSSWDFLGMGQSGAHILVVDSDADLYTVGRNGHGQLGRGDYVDKSTLGNTGESSVLSVDGGFWHSVIIERKPLIHSPTIDEPQVWPMD